MELSGKVESDFYTRTWENMLSKIETITFNYPEPSTFEKQDYDWYIIVALEKADKVTVDRHLLTAELLLSYRWAIREGFNHMLDSALKNRYDYPRNKNTIQGIKSYIARIEKASKANES